MANAANLDTDKASWTIKSVPVETRKLAVAAATRAGESMGVWIERAVRTQSAIEAGDRILPPLPTSRTSRMPAVVPAPVVLDMGALAGLADLMQAAEALAEAAEVPVPKATARHALALVTAQLRAARGLPEKRRRQTSIENGQTIDGEGVQP